jgi:hypothetical protein
MAALLYGRYPQAATHIVDTDVFLVTRSTIKHLNATAAVIWLAIEEPAARSDILAILMAVYPDVAKDALSKDLDHFLRSLLQEGLLVKHRRKIRPPSAKRGS